MLEEDDWEGLLAQRIAEDRVRICAVPLFADGVDLDDEVEVTVGSDAPIAVRVLTDGGNYTFRVIFADESLAGPDERWRELVHGLEPYECWFDVYNPKLLALSAPAQYVRQVGDWTLPPAAGGSRQVGGLLGNSANTAGNAALILAVPQMGVCGVSRSGPALRSW